MVDSFQTKGARNKIDNASDVKLDVFSPWHAIKRLEHPSNCLTIANRRGSSTGGRRHSEQERHQDRRRSFGASNLCPSFSLDSPMWICLRPAPTSPRLCSTSRIGIVFISSRAMRSSLDCHYPVPRTESLVGEHEGEGGMTVGNGDEMWAKCSGELSGSHVIARRRVL